MARSFAASSIGATLPPQLGSPYAHNHAHNQDYPPRVFWGPRRRKNRREFVGATGVEPATPTVSTPPRIAQPQRLRALATRRTPRTAIVISLVFPCLQMIRHE